MNPVIMGTVQQLSMNAGDGCKPDFEGDTEGTAMVDGTCPLLEGKQPTGCCRQGGNQNGRCILDSMLNSLHPVVVPCPPCIDGQQLALTFSLYSLATSSIGGE